MSRSMCGISRLAVFQHSTCILTLHSSGHQGRFGHEFLGSSDPIYAGLIQSDFVPEFDFRVLGDGRSASARYANNSNYRNDSLIRKESGCPTYHSANS